MRASRLLNSNCFTGTVHSFKAGTTLNTEILVNVAYTICLASLALYLYGFLRADFETLSTGHALGYINDDHAYSLVKLLYTIGYFFLQKR